MKSILLICATFFVVSLAKPEGYYHQQYQFQQSSSKYKNNELQEKNQDEGFYSKQGDLEGRHDPKVDEFSSHIQYTNPKFKHHNSEGFTQQTEDVFGQQGLKSHHRRPHGHGFLNGGDSALNFGTTGTRTGYSYSGSYSFGSANSGQLGSLSSGKTYGVDSNLLTVAQKLQTDLSRKLQEAISKQHEQSTYSHTYSSNTAQMNADLQQLQEELKRNLTLQLQEELRRKYGAQGTTGSFSYSITSGHRNPTANYDTAELTDLTKQVESNLLKQLEEGVKTEYRESSHSSSFSSQSSDSTSNVNGGKRIHYPSTSSLDHIQRTTGNERIHYPFNPYPRTENHNVENVNVQTTSSDQIQTSTGTQRIHYPYNTYPRRTDSTSQNHDVDGHTTSLDQTQTSTGIERIHYPRRTDSTSTQNHNVENVDVHSTNTDQTQTSTGTQRIHYPFNPHHRRTDTTSSQNHDVDVHTTSLDQTQTSTGNERIHYPRRTDSTSTQNHNVENVDIHSTNLDQTQTSTGTQRIHYPFNPYHKRTDTTSSQNHGDVHTTLDQISSGNERIHYPRRTTSTQNHNVENLDLHSTNLEQTQTSTGTQRIHYPYNPYNRRTSTQNHNVDVNQQTSETSSSNKPKDNVETFDSSSNTQYVFDERTRQIYPQSSTPRVYTLVHTNVESKPKIFSTDESLSQTSGSKHTYQTIDSTQHATNFDIQELEVDTDSKPINSYNNNRRTDTTYTSTYHIKPITIQTSIPLQTVLGKVENSINSKMVNEEEIRKMIQSIKKYDNPQSFEFVKIKIKSMILTQFDNLLEDELHRAYGKQEKRGSFTYSKPPKDSVNPVYKTADLIDLNESIRNKLKEKIENILNREKVYYETNYTTLTGTNQNQHHEYDVNSGSKPVTVITNPSYSSGSQNKQHVSYSYTRTQNSDNSELNTIRNQLQAQLQQQLQEALRAQSQHQASSSQTSHTYQVQLNDLTEELKRNLTRQLEASLKQHYGEQGQRNGYSYTITTSGGYKPNANYNNQQISDLTKQLEADLTRQLQESFSQQKTYGSYVSSTGSTNFKPVIQIDPIQSSTNSRGRKTYTISGSAYVTGTMPVHKYSGSLSSGSQTYNSGVTEDCLQDDPTTPTAGDSKKTINQFDQQQTQQKFQDHHLEIGGEKIRNTESLTTPKKPKSSSHSITSTQQLISSESHTQNQKPLNNISNAPKTDSESQTTYVFNKQKDTFKPISTGSHTINKHTAHVEIGQQTEDNSELTQLTEDVFGNNKNQAQIGQQTEDDSDLVQIVDDNFDQLQIGTQSGSNKANIHINNHDSQLTQQTEDDFGKIQIGNQNKVYNKPQTGQQTEDDSDLTQQTQDAFSNFEVGQQTEENSQLTQQSEDAFSKFQLGQQTEDDSQLTQQTEDVFGELHVGQQTDALGKLHLDSHQQHQSDLSQHAEDLTQQVQKAEDDDFGTFELGSHQRGQHSGSSTYQSSHSSSYSTHHATQQTENHPPETFAHLDQQQVEKAFAVPTIHGTSSSSNSYSSQTGTGHPGQITAGIASDVEIITATTTQKPGFWKRVGSKIETTYVSAKDKAKSIFTG